MNKSFQKIIKKLISILLGPILAGTLIGGIYAVVQLLRGYEMQKIMSDIMKFQTVAAPYLTGFMVIAMAVLIVGMFKKRGDNNAKG